MTFVWPKSSLVVSVINKVFLKGGCQKWKEIWVFSRLSHCSRIKFGRSVVLSASQGMTRRQGGHFLTRFWNVGGYLSCLEVFLKCAIGLSIFHELAINLDEVRESEVQSWQNHAPDERGKIIKWVSIGNCNLFTAAPRLRFEFRPLIVRVKKRTYYESGLFSRLSVCSVFPGKGG